MRALAKLKSLFAANEKPPTCQTFAQCRERYCISLDSQPQRLEESKRQLAFHHLKLTHFPAIRTRAVDQRIHSDHSVKHLAHGCLQSHLELYRQIVASHPASLNGARTYVAIFEDDLLLLPTLSQLDEFFHHLPEHWDFVYLGGSNHGQPPEILNAHLIRPTFAFNSHAHLVRIDFLPTLITALEKKDAEVDVIFARLQEARIGHWFGFTTDFVWQHGRDSEFYVSLWRHQLGLFHFCLCHGVIDRFIVQNHLELPPQP